MCENLPAEYVNEPRLRRVANVRTGLLSIARKYTANNLCACLCVDVVVIVVRFCAACSI